MYVSDFQYIHNNVKPSPLYTSRTFPSLEKETLYLFSSHSCFLSLQTLATINLLSASKDFPISDTSYKQNHTISGLVRLTSQWNVFKVYPCLSIYHYFVSFFFVTEEQYQFLNIRQTSTSKFQHSKKQEVYSALVGVGAP